MGWRKERVSGEVEEGRIGGGVEREREGVYR